MKELTVRQFATVKRVAMNVNPLVVKKNKIASKIDELNKEYNDLIAEIDGHEMGIKALTGGYISEQLVTRRVEDTGKIDKDNNPIKKTVYEPSDIIKYDEEKKVYYINEPSEDLEMSGDAFHDADIDSSIENNVPVDESPIDKVVKAFE